MNTKGSEAVHSLHWVLLNDGGLVVCQNGMLKGCKMAKWHHLFEWQANYSGSSVLGSSDIMKSLTSCLKHFIATDVTATG